MRSPCQTRPGLWGWGVEVGEIEMGGDAKLCSCHLAVTAPPLLTFRAPKTLPGTSLVVQCLYSELPTQGAWVRSLVGKLRFHKQCSATKGKKK